MTRTIEGGRHERAAKARAHDVFDGQQVVGRIIQNERGFEAFSGRDSYLATYPTLSEATVAIRDAFRAARTVRRLAG